MMTIHRTAPDIALTVHFIEIILEIIPRTGRAHHAANEMRIGAVAALIDALGLMGAERVALDWQKGLGLALMVGGVLLFKR